MPDGISTAPEVRSLIAQERAIWIETQRAVLVAHVARIMGVSERPILQSQPYDKRAEKDARRIAVGLSRAWFRGVWSDVELASLWRYCSSTSVAHAVTTHKALMETDRRYRAQVERVAMALKNERDAQEGRA